MKLHDTAPAGFDLDLRQNWPFKEMRIGQILEIEKSESSIHKKARVAAHAYSSTNDKKFSTKIGSNGSLYIQRIS